MSSFGPPFPHGVHFFRNPRKGPDPPIRSGAGACQAPPGWRSAAARRSASGSLARTRSQPEAAAKSKARARAPFPSSRKGKTGTKEGEGTGCFGRGHVLCVFVLLTFDLFLGDALKR